MGDDTWQYLGTRELASFLGLSPRTLDRYRVSGAGPKFHKFGNRGALRPGRCRGVGGGTPVQLDFRRGQSSREDGVMGGLTVLAAQEI